MAIHARYSAVGEGRVGRSLLTANRLRILVEVERTRRDMQYRSHIWSVLFFLLLTISIVQFTVCADEQPNAAQDGSFVATGRQGMVVTAGEQASEAGVEMLRKGGNAVDAA